MPVFEPEQYGVAPLAYETPPAGGMSAEQVQAQLNYMRAHAMQGFQSAPPVYAPPPQPIYMPNQRKMQSIERRLMKAQYYRALMDGNLFDQTDEVAMEVEREMKDYILSRMEALVGEDPATQAAQKFTEEEIQLLKMWAGALKQKATTASAPPTATPTVRPVTVSPPSPVVTPAPAPQPEVPAAPAAPAVRRKRAPTVRMPATAEASPVAPAPMPPPQVAPPAPAAGGRPKPGKAKNTGPGPKPIPVPQGHYMTSVMETRAAMEVSDRNRVVDTGTTVVQVSKQ